MSYPRSSRRIEERTENCLGRRFWWIIADQVRTPPGGTSVDGCPSKIKQWKQCRGVEDKFEGETSRDETWFLNSKQGKEEKTFHATRRSSCSHLLALSQRGALHPIRRRRGEKCVCLALIWVQRRFVRFPVFFAVPPSVEPLPWEFRKLLYWRPSLITPVVVKQALSRSYIRTSKCKSSQLGYPRLF